MPKKQKPRSVYAKLRSGFHRPTQAFQSKKTYYRPAQKKALRRQTKTT